MEDNAVKRWLGGVNARLRERAERERFVGGEDSLKLDRHHGIAKNFLRLTNKTLIGLNRLHINRWEWAAGLMGMAVGWACAVTDDFVVEVRSEHEGVIKAALVQHILRSQPIKDKLNEALLHNVYTNPDLQYTLHQLLTANAIRPQQLPLQRLSTQALLALLRSPSLRQHLALQAAHHLPPNTLPIRHSALQFLSSPAMHAIVASALSSVVRGEGFGELLAGEVGEGFNGGLMRESNKEKLYLMLREHFINW